ncbi:TniB family NTP-binding protein [uncultured Sphingomonas sp.]|uniref:TniB family NTP-binding protein n=1 Tax=uncultured Sphingomonas sp. TaxID=158754 RepID=UPI0015757D8C
MRTMASTGVKKAMTMPNETTPSEPLDPYGVQPKHILGDAVPDWSNQDRLARAERLEEFFKTNWIEHEPQEKLVKQLVSYLNGVQKLRGRSMNGRRLSEYSNAGKSRMIERLLEVMRKLRAEQGLAPNPYELLCVELDKTTTVYAFFRQILRLMGDDHWNDKRETLDDLEERINKLGKALNVKGIICDEVQHLDRKTTDAKEVTDRFKTFLNRGILPLILVGDEDADKLFDKNDKFATRLSTPLKLKPLDYAGSIADAKILMKFCVQLDADLVNAGLLDRPSGLGKRGLRTPLAHVSGGHVGRVCRVVEEAARNAILRGSPVVEAHDLSVATREFAIGLKWIHRDPFSRRGTP